MFLLGPRAVDCSFDAQLPGEGPYAVAWRPRATGDAAYTGEGRVNGVDEVRVSDTGRRLSQIERMPVPLGEVKPWQQQSTP